MLPDWSLKVSEVVDNNRVTTLEDCLAFLKRYPSKFLHCFIFLHYLQHCEEEVAIEPLGSSGRIGHEASQGGSVNQQSRDKSFWYEENKPAFGLEESGTPLRQRKDAHMRNHYGKIR